MAETTSQPSPSPRPRRYKPWYNLTPGNLPLPAIVSILHRVSGAGLFLLLFLLLAVLDQSLVSQAGYDWARGLLAHPFMKLVMTGLAWSFCHHFFAGLRFLLLDLLIGIDLQSARNSSWMVLGASILATIVLGAKFVW